MNPVRFLPPTCWSQQTIHLPATEAELLRLAMALQGKSAALAELIGDSPAILIYAATEFFREHQRPPDLAAELTSWFGDFAIQRMPDLPEGWSGDSGKSGNRKWPLRFIQAARKYSAPDGNRRLRKSLVKLTRLIPVEEPLRPKVWIHSIIGKEIKGRHLKTSRREQSNRVAAKSKLAESMIELACKIANQEDEFESRLQQAKLNAMKQLAYGASHEINNPLANVATRAQCLMTGESNPERRRKLAVIYEQAMRAHEMISDMMLFAHPPQPSLELTDVYELIKKVVQEMRPEIRKRSASVDLRQYPGVEKIWLDKTQIAVAVKAVIKNSLESFENKSDTERGKIAIRIWRDKESQLEISFTDNGIGVDREAAEHLFDPFFSGREAGRGLGFGLSKAWRISQVHRGQLVWNADFADGAQFILRLPAKQIVSARIDNASAA